MTTCLKESPLSKSDFQNWLSEIYISTCLTSKQEVLNENQESQALKRSEWRICLVFCFLTRVSNIDHIFSLDFFMQIKYFECHIYSSSLVYNLKCPDIQITTIQLTTFRFLVQYCNQDITKSLTTHAGTGLALCFTKLKPQNLFLKLVHFWSR
jgi:hypothetical protein